MAVTQYIGSRYVPLFADPIEWSASNTYEPLTIVIHEGNSYTSKQAVPKDIDISNESFWALTGNYNAQVELYRRETALAKATADDALETANATENDVVTLLPKAAFDAINTVQKYIDDNVIRLVDLISARPLTFDTVADMQAASNMQSGMTCHTNGFHAIGDGGAAYYIVTSDATPNGMDVLALSNNLYATLVITEPYVTPEQFGAYGDGTTDDSANIQRACAVSRNVKLNDKIYGIKSTVRVTKSPFSITGVTSGHGSRVGTRIRALNDFNGSYLISFDGENLGSEPTPINRALLVKNIEFVCSYLCGGLEAIHVYDNSVFECLYVRELADASIGIRLYRTTIIQQQVTMNNVEVQSNTNGDEVTPMIQLDRMQECSLTLVKCFGYKRPFLQLRGCVGITMDMCSAYAYVYTGNTALQIKPYDSGDKSANIRVTNFLNEGCENGLIIYGLGASLVGSFSNVTSGDIISQGNNRAYVRSVTNTSVNCTYLDDSEFTTGACSAGEITSITENYSQGFVIDNFTGYYPSTGNQKIKLRGVADSFVSVPQSTKNLNTHTNFTFEKCLRLDVKKNPYDTISNSSNAKIGDWAPLVYYVTDSNPVVFPAQASLGSKIVVKSNGNATDVVCYSRSSSVTIDGYRGISCSYFHELILEYIDGMYSIISCDGSCNYVSGTVYSGAQLVKTNADKIVDLTETSNTLNRWHSGLTYQNNGSTVANQLNLNLSACPVGFQCFVCAINNNITVNVSNGSFADGSTSHVVSAGSSTTLKVIASGIVALL